METRADALTSPSWNLMWSRAGVHAGSRLARSRSQTPAAPAAILEGVQGPGFPGSGACICWYRAVLLVKAQQFLWLSLHSRTFLSDAQVLPPAPTLKGQQKPVRIPGAHFQKSLMCDNKKVTGAL